MDSPIPQAHQRHWPLDLPSGLPFERYEHRRLTARDILVHRIMKAIVSPQDPSHSDNNPALAAALAAPRQPASRIEFARTYDARIQTHSSKMLVSMPYHNFSGLKAVEPTLARDVEVLRKMLVTRSSKEWIHQDLVKPVKPVAAWPGVRPPEKPFSEGYKGPPRVDQRPPVEEEILDLVRMHYMESDDPVTRLWLGMIAMPRKSSYQTLPKMTAKQDSHKKYAQERVAWQERNEAEDYKRWYPEDTAHLKALKSQTQAATNRPLYEGGAFLPRFQRRVVQSKAFRVKYLQHVMEMKNQSYFTDEHNGQQIQDELYPWPEGDAPRRVLHVPSVYSWRQKQHFFRSDMPSVDFASGRPGRCLDRDGIWSTGRWYGDDAPRGRSTRRTRRRAASEPPPGAFTSARLHVSFNSTREVLIFPKMSLISMERRTRRRSLSRTRIAEMFNWDITLDDPPPRPPIKPNMMDFLAAPPKNMAKRLNYAEIIQKLTPSMKTCSKLWAELYHGYLQNRLSAHAVVESALVATLPSSLRDSMWPQCWASVDDADLVELRREYDEKVGLKYSLHLRNPKAISPSTPCSNCTSTDHQTKQCRLPCGHCGAPNPYVEYKHLHVARNRWGFLMDYDDEDNAPKAGEHDNPHLAPSCPVARHNRCKCTSFPQFHTAAKCLVVCSRPCGNVAHPPGHFKHRNAMECKSRCCMCGMRGHSGVKCRYKSCRCGGKHLGQDCGWQPACRVAGCHRFHCGVHCRLCGVDWHTLGDDLVHVGGLCPTCCSTASQSLVHVDEEVKGKRKPRPRKKRDLGNEKMDAKAAGKTKKAWYAPLEPRTRPVVGAKSGKCASRWDKVAGDGKEKKVGVD